MLIFLKRLSSFHLRVVRDFFFRNHGILLSGAVAYNIMLSLIPLSALVVVVLSKFFDAADIMDVLAGEVTLIAPGYTQTVREVVSGFLANRHVIGWIGGGSLVFFSSMAFRVLEDSIAIIFHRPMPSLKRSFWVSALLPYLFIGIITAGVVVVSSFNSLVEAGTPLGRFLPGVEALMHANMGLIAYAAGFIGLVMLFTLFYRIMPVARISFLTALAGGFTAAVLWEGVRHLLVRYFATMSSVNILYGSLAGIIIVLFTLEIAAIILLFGAQVIAEFHGNKVRGLPWWVDGEKEPEEGRPAAPSHPSARNP